MALSGSRNFILTRDQIIASALRKIGVVAQGESPTLIQYHEGSEALNVMVQAWQAKGTFLWTLIYMSIDLQSNIHTYELSDDDNTLEIITAKITSGLDSFNVKIIPLEEYIKTKDSKITGIPDTMAVRQYTTSVRVLLHPTPNANMTLTYGKINRLQDFIGSTDNPDFPVQWTEALIQGLAYRLCYEYGISLKERQLLGMEAENSFRAALIGSRQSGGIQFSPRRR